MSATIGDILALSGLRECHLLNQGVSLGQSVKSATIMDNPEILNWMCDCEILFSNGSSLASLTSAEWRAFFKGLSDKKSAGLFIKLQYYVDSIPSDAVDYATSLDLPIVVVPNSYSWVRLSTPIQQYLIKEQFYLVNEAFKLGNALADAMARGGSLDRVCDVAGEYLHCKVTVFHSGDWSQVDGANIGGWTKVEETLKSKMRGQTNVPFSFDVPQVDGACRAVRTEKRSSKYYGVYWNPDSSQLDLSDFEIDQVSSAMMLCIMKEDDLRKIEEHYYYEFLSELLDGSLRGKDEIAARTSRLQRSVHDAYQLIACQSRDDAPVRYDGFIRSLKAADDPLVRDVMYCARERYTVFFCPVSELENRDRIQAVCDRVRSYVDDKTMRFAVSQVQPLTRISEGYQEALSSLSLLNITSRPILYYADLGLLRLLARNATSIDVPFVANFYEDVFGKISVHDRESKVGLKDTLKVYFANDESIPATARALYIHENTLRMRLKSIETLSGRSLHNSRGRVELYLATVLGDFIS